jgi:hypothetical protein
MRISKNSKRALKDVFAIYTSDDFRFDKSHISIELGKYEEDSFVSRSQAKRLLTSLGKFRKIILDFKNIRIVGQGFVDAVFGVFGLENPEINFDIINANEDILFMIQRGLREREKFLRAESLFYAKMSYEKNSDLHASAPQKLWLRSDCSGKHPLL